MTSEIGVLGPVVAWTASGDPVALRGPRHRAVLARLVVANGRVVPLDLLVDDLWEDPPVDAVGAIRTFVADLRRAVEPDRPPRARPSLIVTQGSGYALTVAPAKVDARRFERDVASVHDLSPAAACGVLTAALASWRGPAYADVAAVSWAQAESARLADLRLHAIELLAAARIDLGRAGEVVPDLDAHVSAHPWREEGRRLLALALYRAGRQAEALQVIARARRLSVDRLGVEPGPALRRLEVDILNQADHLDPSARPGEPADGVWLSAVTTFRRRTGPVGAASGSPAPGTRARLRSTVDLLRGLAVTGGAGLEESRQQRLQAILAAEALGDAALTARVIGAYDVPAVWSRPDDPDQAASVVAAAERALLALPVDGQDSSRCRLLSTIAVESRGLPGPRGREAAEAAERIARRLDDPRLLAFALNGVFLQSFDRPGGARRRDALGAELVRLSARHELVTYELLGHLVRLQACSATGDLDRADRHAEAADRLAADYESPLVAVFTGWYRALRSALTDRPEGEVERAYRAAAAATQGSGMPGVEDGLLALSLLALRMQHGRPAPTAGDLSFGGYEPWARPLVLLAQDRRTEAASALEAVPDPPAGHLVEALWCLTGRAGAQLGARAVMRRAFEALTPAADEHAGAGTGMFTLGPVRGYLEGLTRALGQTDDGRHRGVGGVAGVRR